MKLLFLIMILTVFGKPAYAADVTILIKGGIINKGKVFVGVYTDPKEFPDGAQKAGQFVDCEKNTIRLVFTDLADGKYAFAAFQDENGNEELDLNFIGIPKEKYGFSGRLGFGRPKFENVAIDINSKVKQVTISMD